MENLIGTSGTNTLTGTAGNNLLNGKAGDDYIDGGAGSDMIIAGAGNDTIVYDGIDKKIDGGTDYDTLLFLSTNQSLNLSTNLAVTNIEQLWLYGGGGHQLWFTAADIIRVSDVDRLVIKGDRTDTITLGDLSGWTLPTAVNPDGSVTFTNGAASFTATPGMQIDGYSQAANINITAPAVLAVQEDTNVSADGFLTLHISVQVNDVNPGESVLSASGFAGNLGTLTLADATPTAGGSLYHYDYKVSNDLIQYLNTGSGEIDHFYLSSLDGTTTILDVAINGQDENHVPVITNAPSTIYIDGVPGNAEILANTITRHGTFFISDSDTSDIISVSCASSKISLQSPLHVQPTLWAVNWTFAINDDDLQRMAAGDNVTEIIPIVASDNHGGSTTWNISYTLSGDLTDTGITGKTIGSTGDDNANVGADQWYFGDSGNDLINGSSSSSLMVGGTGNDVFEGNGIMFGDEGNDEFYLDSALSNAGKAYGGDGQDYFLLKDTTNFQVFGNADSDGFDLDSGNVNLQMRGGSGLDFFSFLHLESHADMWILDFEFDTPFVFGDRIIQANSTITRPDPNMIQLNLVTVAPGDSSVPPGVSNYYELWLSPDGFATPDSAKYHLLNLIASDGSTTHTSAEMFDQMRLAVFHG